jgi:hypothetical protein
MEPKVVRDLDDAYRLFGVIEADFAPVPQSV